MEASRRQRTQNPGNSYIRGRLTKVEPNIDASSQAFPFVYSRGYNSRVTEIRQTAAYARWFKKLRDRNARSRILARIRRLSLGNPGLVKPVGEGVSELKVDYGPGYRIYVKKSGNNLVVLLAGGNKRTQKRDIATAKALARGL